MAIDGINNYLSTSATAATTTAAQTKKAGTSLDMDDFLKLMVAQLQNQDMNNTADTSQYTAQMAQFSMVQALTELNEMTKTTYSMSLIDKDVILAENAADGSLHVVAGTVQGVNLYDGEAQVIVNGVSYPVSSIMEVAQAK
ncbi:flagellar hook capping FlgD N-terminal domain-containing protein [Acetobacterium sp. K1/6]|uniref:flagellar hook capping FlgD N-terminal domain-containing protein n=1 Tax=Acetobacterium sp. K1/6 TaxID=3055467 RepID=UPI002ACA6719|nr:flagellar hook capping FlgD N-terminal domain-containing protein [Acetobacterium sp. K1/6]MDZ5724865.1 flagellar hook capping FlgD N-terminal domain-containing protein [Acetobacterium sp. K1/6]